MIEICSIGGYNEVGKNSTAVKIDDDVFILDLGIYLESYVKLTEDEEVVSLSGDALIKAGAVPDVSFIHDWGKKVKAIVPTHAHLDHVGAIPFLAERFLAPVYCTPFTAEVIKETLHDQHIKLPNKIKSVQSNSFFNLNNNIKIEFIHVTHSTPHTVIIAVHTKFGTVMYANDFKLDLSPTLGKKPNFKRLEELGKNGVLALIIDSTYANDARKMPSEAIAKEKLRDVLLNTDSKNKGIIVTTFSSHIARLSSVVEFGKKLNRKIIFMGRSLAKYCNAAKRAGIMDFSNDVEICRFSKQIKQKLKRIESDREKYLLVVTGHQGEPKSTLYKIATGEFKYKINPQEHIVFSSRVIPTQTNQANSERLDEFLKEKHARIFRGVHESGHAAREDLRDMIELVKPKHIIPAHGHNEMKNALAELAVEMGYKRGSNVHIMSNGQRLRI